MAEGIVIKVNTKLTEPLWTKGDPSDLKQVFVNILINSADAILERTRITGKKEGTITITTKQEGEQVITVIADDGIGMGEEIRQRVFDAFFTTKGELGSGLGMNVALGIVLLYGGNINIQSVPMQGTAVTVTFPAYQPERVAESVEAVKTLELPRWRILVVDDHPLVRHAISEMLQRLGQEVLVASNGAEGWEMLQTEKVNLLITDLSMPVMNGIELSKLTRERFPELPIVMMTGWGDFIPRDSLSFLGINFVLSKPMGLKVWRETLQKLMLPS